VVVTPLPKTAETLKSSLSQLFTSLEVMEIPIPSIPQSAPGTKAWELGRQAYLNWAVGKMVHPENAGTGAGPGAKGEERMEGIEREMAGVGNKEAMEAMGRAAGV
jgi:kinetochore protein Mis12/MTW1